LRRTLRTAGRTVLFSSVTVAFSVAALTIFPQRFLYSMGIAGAIVALLAATLALTVLPALLAVLGPRVNALSPRRLRHAAERDARPAGSGAWYRLAQFVTGSTRSRPLPQSRKTTTVSPPGCLDAQELVEFDVEYRRMPRSLDLIAVNGMRAKIGDRQCGRTQQWIDPPPIAVSGVGRCR
jgi:hypothetical protein